MPDLFDLATRVHGAVEWGHYEAAEDALREALADAWDEGGMFTLTRRDGQPYGNPFRGQARENAGND